jgi:cysteine desulfurase
LPEAARLTVLRDALIKGIQEKVQHTRLNGHPTKRLPNSVNIGIDFVRGDSVALGLDVEGVAVSTGSACSSGNAGPSAVLLAMGLSKDDARSSVRFSLGRDTSQDVVNYVLELLPTVVARFRKMSPAYDKFLKEGGKGK